MTTDLMINDLKQHELLQSVQKGNKKAAVLFYQKYAVSNAQTTRNEDYLVDLTELTDSELTILHQHTNWIAPSYFFRLRHYRETDTIDDEKLMVLVQSSSKKAKEEYLARYTNNLTKAPDEALVMLAQGGDDAALDQLVNDYIPFVKKIIQKLERKYFFRGLDTSDLVQEGVMGLFKSKNDFKIERKTKFKDFSKHVIEKHMGTLILRSANYKNKVLNESFSYHTPIGSDSEITFEQMLKSDTYKPEDTYISSETYKAIRKRLTDLEREVLKLYALGLSYEEIGERVGKKKKAIDNTIQRIRKKGKQYMENYI